MSCKYCQSDFWHSSECPEELYYRLNNDIAAKIEELYSKINALAASVKKLEEKHANNG